MRYNAFVIRKINALSVGLCVFLLFLLRFPVFQYRNMANLCKLGVETKIKNDQPKPIRYNLQYGKRKGVNQIQPMKQKNVY